jgi:hypothetical protein
LDFSCSRDRQKLLKMVQQLLAERDDSFGRNR